MTPVPPDHFLRQFDSYPEGEKRLAAMAAHAAMLLNSLRSEQEAHTATICRFSERLCEVSPEARVAWDVFEELQERVS
jgi:hypothetical protein